MLFKGFVYKLNKEVLVELLTVNNGKWVFKVMDTNLKYTGSNLSLDTTSSNKLQFHKFSDSVSKDKFDVYMDALSDKINREIEKKLEIEENITAMQRIKFELQLKANEVFGDA